jgi:hypothetical protein
MNKDNPHWKVIKWNCKKPTISQKRGLPYEYDDKRKRKNMQVFKGISYGFFSSVPERHIAEIIVGATSKGFSGKTTEMARYSENHRTTISHFLRRGKWDDEKLKECLRKETYRYIVEQAGGKNSPLFLSIDDTVNPKKRPSSQAKKPMEGGAYHYSHLLGKTVWGHQIQAAIVSTGKTALCYEFKRYDKEADSKIQNIRAMAASLPEAGKNSYALMDSWYTCPKIIDAFAAKGYHTIGALKTNRIIYPNGIRIPIREFASRYIKKSDTDLVTVNRKKYDVYRYEGSLNGIDHATVLISFPENAFGNEQALRAFLCTDCSLDAKTVLQYYTNRWNIEIFFKQQKNLAGFGGYQMRSIKAIERFWTILSLTHFYCVARHKQPLPFGESVRQIRTSVSKDIARYIYDAGRQGIPFNTLSLPVVC